MASVLEVLDALEIGLATAMPDRTVSRNWEFYTNVDPSVLRAGFVAIQLATTGDYSTTTGREGDPTTLHVVILAYWLVDEVDGGRGAEDFGIEILRELRAMVKNPPAGIGYPVIEENQWLGQEIKPFGGWTAVLRLEV